MTDIRNTVFLQTARASVKTARRGHHFEQAESDQQQLERFTALSEGEESLYPVWLKGDEKLRQFVDQHKTEAARNDQAYQRGKGKSQGQECLRVALQGAPTLPGDVTTAMAVEALSCFEGQAVSQLDYQRAEQIRQDRNSLSSAKEETLKDVYRIADQEVNSTVARIWKSWFIPDFVADHLYGNPVMKPPSAA
jgi:hypothetical protein